MFQAAKFGDLVTGVDLHMVMVPTPAGPVPTPLPHPFIGVVFDPLGAAIGAGIGAVFGGGGPVLINSLPVGNTGIGVRGIPHFPTPPGVAFAPNDIPDNSGVIVTGSKTVHMAGTSAGRLTSLVASCNFPLNLPTSVCLAVPMGAPVLIGGPTSLDVMAAVTRGIRTKWFSDLLHKVLKPGRFLSKVICFLTGHPVDVVSGRVLADATDFALSGPVPIAFERNYDSRNRSEGPLGPGWHHPLSAEIREETGALRVRLPDGREIVKEPLPEGACEWDDIDRFALERKAGGYTLTFWDGRAYRFEKVPGAAASHPLTRITDRCDNAISLRYERGQLREVIDSVGRKLAFETSGGRLRAIRLERGDEPAMELIRYEYDPEGRLAAAVDPLGHATRYAYRGGVLVKETNRNGLSFYFEYDAYEPDGWCVRTWGDGGIYDRRITYDKARHFTVVDDARGGRTMYYGNAAGLVDREVDPTGREKRYEWDLHCRKVAEIDGLGNRTEWAYDARGNRVLERDALGNETRWRYDALNLPVEKVDAAGGVWRREYDRRGKLVRAIDPLGNVMSFRHDGRGNLVLVEDGRGHTARARYSEAGELAEVTDREGHARRYAWSARGSVIRAVNALGGETAITRDTCNRPVEVRFPDGSVERLSYDPEGNVTERVDALGNVTRYRYGGFNKLVERVDPLGFAVRYAYDAEESLTEVTNEIGEAYRFEVDLAGRVVTERGFDGRRLAYRYDRAGRCIETTNGQDKRTAIERDALGRVVKRVVPKKPMFGDPIPEGEAITYAYGALGGLVRATNGSCEVVLARDALGRVVREEVDGVVVESRYDAAGNRVARRTSLGQETAYDFDGNGDLLGVMFGRDPRWKDFSPESLAAGGPVRAPWQATFKRDALGLEVQRRLPGEVMSGWRRDVAGRPQVQRVAREGEPVLGTGYKWRSNEQLEGLIDTSAGPTWFEHDARGYLVSARRPDGAVEVRAPDAVGNVYRRRDQSDRVYGRGGALTEAGGTRYTHDADGQLIEKVLPDGRVWRYAWDHAGQLEAVVRPDGERVSFAYDALGRRVGKTFRGRTTRYVWDGNDLVHEVTDGADLVTWEFEPGSFAPLAKMEGKRRYGVVADHLGAPRALFDEVGKLSWKAQLDLYGVAQEEVAETRCPWRWPGQYEDEETGLYYNRFRYYDPEAGRYVSQDPIGLVGGTALYGYADDTLTRIDPLGLSACNTTNPREVRFSQNSILSTFRDSGNIFELAKALRQSSELVAMIEPIRLTMKDGLLYTLDNRRLAAFRLANVEVPYVMATAEAVAKDAWKFTTTNSGVSIWVRDARRWIR